MRCAAGCAARLAPRPAPARAARRRFAAPAAPPRRSPQHGEARVHVERVCGATSFSRLAHSSPVRLLPISTHATARAGAAWCASGTFGGGLLGGDVVDLDVRVGERASLALVTQASTKVYRAKRDRQPVVQRLEARVLSGGLLLVAPDPLVPFAESLYEQRLAFDLAGGSGAEAASLVVVDWLCAGRTARGERWLLDGYRSRCQVSWRPHGGGAHAGCRTPAVVEALSLERASAAPGLGAFDIAVSVVLAGPRAQPVVARLEAAAAALAARAGARVAERASDGFALPLLHGSTRLGVTSCPRRDAGGDSTGQVSVARVVAERTDDVYRLLHACLLPLSEPLGLAPYADRIHAQGAPALAAPAAAATGAAACPHGRAPLGGGADGGTVPLSVRQQLALAQLTDATLPTGGFAHSSGVEAAMQLGLFGAAAAEAADPSRLRAFLLAAARSSLRLQGPFVAAAHRLLEGAAGLELGPSAVDAWRSLDDRLHAHLAASAPACQASGLQGSALARALKQWAPLPGLPPRGHCATVLGLAAARVGLPRQAALSAFAYCAVRDSVSAAVRLNLLGPLRAVDLQAGMLLELAPEVEALLEAPLDGAAGCAPLVDCAHAAHGLLDARMFMT